MRQLTLQRLHISPFPVIGTLITNEEAIPSVDFLWVTFDANNVFFDRGKNQWGLPLPRDFFLPAFEELESAAKFIDDGFSGSSLAVGHSTLRNYAKNRGLERKPRPMLVQQFGFTK